MSGRLGYATARATATTHRTDSTPAAAMPNPQKNRRSSHLSQAGRLGGGVLAGPVGLEVFSCMEGRGVTRHYKKPLPSNHPIFVTLATR
ncbi:Uncharacterised protein [Mycobacterium tuberculosis]|nr:Uncharacterised protein [Mycobacterium tuberculosis]